MGIIIHADGQGPLPSVVFPFSDGTEEVLLWDVDHWQWYWQHDDGTRERLRGVTKTVHYISKGDVIANWAKKVCFERLRALLIERHLGPDNTLQLWIDELDSTIKEAKRANEDILVDAASVGHIAHAHIESWIKAVLADNPEKQDELVALLPVNPVDPGDERPANCVVAALTWVAEHNVRFETTERPVFSRRFRYAGTCDGTALIDSCSNPKCCPVPFKDHRSIVDHKTCNATVPYLEYVFQVCSYQQAIEEQTGEKYEDRWINLYDKVTGKFSAWRFAGREQYERGFEGFRRTLDLSESVDQTQDLLDTMRDARREAEEEEKAAEKAEQKKIDCGNKKYKGVRPPKCGPCQRCLKLYEENHNGKES